MGWTSVLAPRRAFRLHRLFRMGPLDPLGVLSLLWAALSPALSSFCPAPGPFPGMSCPQRLPQLGTALQMASSRAGAGVLTGRSGQNITADLRLCGFQSPPRRLPGCKSPRICFLLINSICNCRPAAQSSKEGAETFGKSVFCSICWPMVSPCILPSVLNTQMVL